MCTFTYNVQHDLHTIMYNMIYIQLCFKLHDKKMTLISCYYACSLTYILCLISDSTKTIRLLALDFYEVIVDSGFVLINYHLIEISSS